MIASIVVTGTHNIGMSSSKKINAGDTVLSAEKEIPFVRYRFNKYTDTEYTYIKSMMQKFNLSTHLAEVNLSSETPSIIERLHNEIGNIAKYVYIDITDEIVEQKSIGAELENQFVAIAPYVRTQVVDRVMLRDKSRTLDTITVKALMKRLSTLAGVKDTSFGVCSSPLSFSDWACLTAVKARELMSKYSTIADVALPSANHQCMNCCGCIRYFVIDSDTEAPSDEKARKKKESVKKDTNTTVKPKVAKARVRFGMHNL